MGAGFDIKYALSGGVFENFGGFPSDFCVWRGRLGREVHPDTGYASRFRLGLGLRGWGIRDLNGVLRFEANFGLSPFFLGV